MTTTMGVGVGVALVALPLAQTTILGADDARLEVGEENAAADDGWLVVVVLLVVVARGRGVGLQQIVGDAMATMLVLLKLLLDDGGAADAAVAMVVRCDTCGVVGGVEEHGQLSIVADELQWQHSPTR